MIKTSISGGFTTTTAEVVKRIEEGHQHKHPPGLAVYTLPYSREENRAIAAVSSDGSSSLNVNGLSTGGTPDQIHDGTDSVLWTATNLSGSNFVFDSTDQAQAGTKSISGVNTVNNDQALLTRSSAINHANYSGLTGFIYISSWADVGTKEVEIKFRLGGVDIGSSVGLSQFINTTNLGVWQSFTIPFTNGFALTGVQLDELVITTVDIGGGQAPDYYLDALRLNDAAGGSPKEFVIAPRRNEIMYVKGIELTVAFPFDPTATVAGATENFTVPVLSYNKFFHLNQLANGLVIRREQVGRTQFSSTIRNNFDLLEATDRKIYYYMSDGTNSMMKIVSDFSGIVELDSQTNDRYIFTVNDNLTTLLEFKIRGRATTIREAR